MAVVFLITQILLVTGYAWLLAFARVPLRQN